MRASVASEFTALSRIQVVSVTGPVHRVSYFAYTGVTQRERAFWCVLGQQPGSSIPPAKNAVFFRVSPCSLVPFYPCFEGNWHLHVNDTI